MVSRTLIVNPVDVSLTRGDIRLMVNFQLREQVGNVRDNGSKPPCGANGMFSYVEWMAFIDYWS